jgi:Mg-chelatase subunit ChlD
MSDNKTMSDKTMSDKTMSGNSSPSGAGTTLLVLVVDRSGSMQSIRADMEGGIKRLLEDQAKGPGTCLVTLAQFDTQYELVLQAVPVAEVPGYELVPRGSTALLDAIGRTIGEVRSSLDKMPPGRRPEHVVFAVVTDGLENSSREWSRDKVMAAVKECSNLGWLFTFLGANQDAIQEGGNIGVGPAGAMTYAAAPGAVAAAMGSLSAAVGRVRHGTAKSLAYTEEERRQSGSA